MKLKVNLRCPRCSAQIAGTFAQVRAHIEICASLGECLQCLDRHYGPCDGDTSLLENDAVVYTED